MSRTPSLDRDSAEQMLGTRGNLIVNVDNRALVRKWLVACGVPAAAVGTLTLSTLAKAYNDATDATLNDLLANAAKGETTTAPTPIVSKPVDNTQEVANELARVLAGLKTTAAVDADMVRKIMREELPNLIPVTRLEIVEDGFVRDLGAKVRHNAFVDALTVVSQEINLALIGPAGSGKTTACEQIAEALELPFYMQGAVSGAHEFLGYCDAQGRYQSTPFRQAYEHGGLFLADEIDAGDPAGTLVINSALANGHQAFPDRTEPVKKHKHFRFIAAANTYGTGADRVYIGRNQMDGATLDRFAYLDWNYDEKLERMIAGNDSWVDRVQALRRGAEKEKARVVISPRASINGAKLLAANMTRDKVEQMLIWRGMDSDLRRRIEQAAK